MIKDEVMADSLDHKCTWKKEKEGFFSIFKPSSGQTVMSWFKEFFCYRIFLGLITIKLQQFVYGNVCKVTNVAYAGE